MEFHRPFDRLDVVGGTICVSTEQGPLRVARVFDEHDTDAITSRAEADALAGQLADRNNSYPELVAALRELIGAGDNSVRGDQTDDAAAMLRFAAADKTARALLSRLGELDAQP